ncbi:MAG: hypothetical protein F7C35_06825 [Desulfurococcales archaeon]|nr:hypothetical protein [Desulfurococcales archaeon]
MQCKPAVEVPLKVISGEIKRVIGPYVRVRGHYYLQLNLNIPDPVSARWELHILTDPENHINEEEGVAVVEGYKFLAKHKCLRKVIHPLPPGLRGSLFYRPWGVAGVWVTQTTKAHPEDLEVLRAYGMGGAIALLRRLAGEVEIIEV